MSKTERMWVGALTGALAGIILLSLFVNSPGPLGPSFSSSGVLLGTLGGGLVGALLGVFWKGFHRSR